MNRAYLPLILLIVAAPVFAQDNAATRKLTQQSKQFEEQIVKGADKVHVAVGLSPANVSMLVGEDGVVIVDTGMTRDDADRIVAEVRKITDEPVKAIILRNAGSITGVVDLVKDPSRTGSLARSTTLNPPLIPYALTW